MKIIVLDSTAKSIKAVLASSVATSNPDFVVAYADTSDNTFSELSSDGQLNGTTDVTLVSAPASGVKRAIKSITIYNRDTAPVIVVIKLDVSGTQRILQRVQLVSGETWHSDELTKLSPGGSDTQVQFNDTGTLAGSSNFTYNKTTSVLTLGANPVLSGGTANGVLYLNGSKSATTGSVLTFDGAQLGVNGITLGRGAGAVATNTALGASALAANTSGANNTAVGNNALYSNITGATNTAFGSRAGYFATSSDNTLVGNDAGRMITTGSNNTALGSYVMNNSAGVTGSENVGIGRAVLTALTSGSYNIAVGSQALFSNTTASNNTAVGYQSLYLNTTGVSNTAAGMYALYSNNGGSNSAFGWNALSANTTGNYNAAVGTSALASNTTASANTAMGYQALVSNTTASNNTAVGYQAGYSNTTGIGFTAVGREAGYSNTTASYGTYIGNQAGLNATGTLNTFVGWASGFQVTTGSKNTIIGGFGGNQGSLDIRTSSNNIVLSDGDGNPRAYCNSTGVWAVAGATVNRSGAGLSAAKGIGAQNDATARFATIEYGSGASGSFTTITIAFAVDSAPASVILEVLMTAYSSVYLDHVAGRYGSSAAVVMRNNASAGTTVSTLSVANVGGYDTYTLTITTSVTHPVVKIKATVGGLASGLTGIPTITFA